MRPQVIRPGRLGIWRRAAWVALGLGGLGIVGCGQTSSEVGQGAKPVEDTQQSAAAAEAGARAADAAGGRQANGSKEVEEPKAITLDPAAQARLGVGTTTLKSESAPTGVATTARVLDPGPLFQLDSELASAAASFEASRAEAQRTRKLFAEDRTASAKAVEVADAQAQADQQRVFSARRRLALEWGDGIASLAPGRRAAFLDDLVHLRVELIRVEMPPNTAVPKPGAIVGVRGDPGASALGAVVLGMLPTADPRLQTRGVLAELRGSDANLPIGQMLAAQVPTQGTSVAGVVLPRAALLRKDSLVWAYVQTAPTTFLRKEVSEYRPVLSGWFVEKGFAPGDRVVTAGAAALLAVETPAEGND